MEQHSSYVKKACDSFADARVYAVGTCLYVNISNHCTLACHFCTKPTIPLHSHTDDVDINNILDQIGHPASYEEVIFCGNGEPTLCLKGLVLIANAVKAAGGKTRLYTDGLGNLFHQQDIIPLLSTCIDAICISLNANNEYLYEKHCMPSLPHSYPAVLAFIKRAASWIPDTTVTAIEGLEGVDLTACERIAHEHGAQFQLRATVDQY